MNAHAFGEFLKKTLLSKAEEYKGGLIDVNFKDMSEGARKSGICNTLMGIAHSIDSLLSEFEKKNN